MKYAYLNFQKHIPHRFGNWIGSFLYIIDGLIGFVTFGFIECQLHIVWCMYRLKTDKFSDRRSNIKYDYLEINPTLSENEDIIESKAFQRF